MKGYDSMAVLSPMVNFMPSLAIGMFKSLGSDRSHQPLSPFKPCFLDRKLCYAMRHIDH